MFIEEITKLTIKLLIVMAIAGGMFYVADKGIKKNEKNECLKWEEQKQKYPCWYSAEWQVEQCSFYSIDL